MKQSEEIFKMSGVPDPTLLQRALQQALTEYLVTAPPGRVAAIKQEATRMWTDKEFPGLVRGEKTLLQACETVCGMWLMKQPATNPHPKHQQRYAELVQHVRTKATVFSGAELQSFLHDLQRARSIGLLDRFLMGGVQPQAILAGVRDYVTAYPCSQLATEPSQRCEEPFQLEKHMQPRVGLDGLRAALNVAQQPGPGQGPELQVVAGGKR